MKFTILLLSICLFFKLNLSAQNTYSVKGVVVDTAANAKLFNTSIIILNAKDSTLVTSARASRDGSFAIGNLHKGKFILLTIYPGYADYVEQFSLDSTKTTQDFGKLNMILKSKLLADVIVKAQRVPIKIKGDTTEFNAKAYVIQPNDKVEDLLRQLPGIQVDKDGKITAQGETVSKVLVDGEEFFGDDPTLVTKNLRADMVDKVQLYDKKSDQAAFTGIDDGVKTKTINIKLKEDKKNGLFGKVNANVGTDGYYEGQLIFNKFKAKEKFAAYGTAANDGRTGLGFSDSNNLGAGGGAIQFVDGGISVNFSGNNDALDSFSGYYDGKGVPIATSGGLHYDTKWNSDKESLNTNYKLGSMQVNGVTTTATQQTLANGTFNTNSNQNFNNYAFRQKLDLTYQLKIDTAADLKLSADATLRNFHVNNDYSSKTDSAGVPLNSNQRSVTNHGDARVFDASALYTKKFKKVGRTLSWSVAEAYNQSETDGYLNSETDYYNFPGGLKQPPQLINQYKTSNSVSSVLNSNITWSEPFSKKTALLFNYGLGINNSTTDLQSFNQSAPGLYNSLDTAYSNSYKFNQVTNQLGAIFNYKSGKLIFNFGTKVSGVDYKQVDEFTGNEVKRSFLNWAPQALFQYKFSQQHSFSFNYNGSTTQPTISQIQPVLNNTDPLNLTVGNQKLKPSFTNRFNINYNDFQVISGQSFFISARYSNTYDAIVNNTTEADGTNTTQYVNLANKVPYNYSVYAYLGRQIKPLAGIALGLNVNTSANVSYSYINKALDEADSHTYSAGLSINKYVQKKYNFNINAGPSYTFSTMSLEPQANNNAAGFNTRGRFDLYLPLNFGAGSDVNYDYTAKTQSFSAEYKTIWNAYIFKSFRKDESFKISASVNDLLNQNTNFTRGISGNTTTQTNTTGLKRFFMLSLIWDFTKFGTIPAKN